LSQVISHMGLTCPWFNLRKCNF